VLGLLGPPPTTIQNGGFELGDLTSWVASGNVTVRNYIPAQQGTYFCAFNDAQRTPNGRISQTVSTTPGTLYTLTFYAGAEAYNQTATQKTNVTVTGSGTLASQSFSQSVTAGTTA